MKQVDRIMQKNVPGYAYMKKAMPQAAAAREPKKKRQRKPRQRQAERRFCVRA